jgi:methyl-accepting chemotaxis protein
MVTEQIHPEANSAQYCRCEILSVLTSLRKAGRTMKNWKIGLRMAAGFGAVICIAVALGVFAYTRVTTIDTTATLITTDCLPGVFAIGQVQNNLVSAHGLLLEQIVKTDITESARMDSEIQGYRSRNATMLADYEKSITTQADKEMFEALKTSGAAFWSSFDETAKLSEASKNKEAIERYNRELRSLYKKSLVSGKVLCENR